MEKYEIESKRSLLSLSKIDPSILINEFLSGNKNTVEAYRYDLDNFRKFVDGDSIDAVAESFIKLEPAQANLITVKYKSHLIESGLAPKTINRRLTSLKALVKQARFLGLINWELEVKFLKVESYRDTSGCSIENLKKMMELAKQEKNQDKGLRNYCMLRLFTDLALRRQELINLTVADVDFDKGRISILGKGRTEKEYLSLPLNTQLAIKEWLDVRGYEEGALICSFDRKNFGDPKHMSGKAVYSIIRKYGELLGIKTRPHGIRHTSISRAMSVAQENSIPLEKVLKFSRHKSLNTIMIYRDNLEDSQGEIANLVADGI